MGNMPKDAFKKKEKFLLIKNKKFNQEGHCSHLQLKDFSQGEKVRENTDLSKNTLRKKWLYFE